MKKAKSLLAIWLALVLTLTLFPTALAASGVSYTVTGEAGVTVTPPTSGTTTTDNLEVSFTLESGYTNPTASYTVGGGESVAVDSASIMQDSGTYSFTIDNTVITDSLVVTISATAPAATEYTVTYNAGEGTLDPSDTSATVTAGESVTLPTATRDGYTFLGWLISGTSEDNGQTLSADTTTYTPTADVTLTAQWAQNVTVTYSQGDSSSTSTNTSYVGASYTVADEDDTLTPDGQVFTGWLSSADNTTVYQPGDTITLTANLTLTAQYATEVTISFDSGTSSSTSGIPSDTSGAAGSSYTLPTSEPRRNSGSYEFTGWEYSEDGDVYDAGETVTLPDGGTTAVTFTAQWAYRTYPDYDEDDDDSSSSSSSDDEYTIRATASDGGYVSPSGTTYVDEGDDLTITFAPYSGYVIDGVYIDGVLDNSHDGSYTFRDVDEDHTLYVRYIADTGSGSSGSSGDSDTSPKTGDASAPLRMGLGFGSLALIAFLVARRMRRA